jgi:flagellar biosynthesis/type III secretory pathway protein FliH
MKEPTIEITYNGMKYYSEVALAENQLKWYNLGKAVGIEEGKKANGYSSDDIKKLHTDMNHLHHLWYDKGYNAGKSEGYKEGYDDASIKYFDEYSVKLNDRYKNEYDDGYNDGYEQCKHDGISKINLNTESVEQTELSKEYDKGFTKGFEEGYEIGKKANGISAKEIPGEYLSRIEEARKQGYADGYKDCREVAKMLNKYGIDEDYDKGYKVGYEAGKVDNPQYMRAYQAGRNDGFDECKRDSISAKEIPGESLAHIEEARLMGYEEGYIDAKEGGQAEGYIDRREKSKPMMESGDDEEDGEPIGPEHPEYDKGYYAGWEDGKNHIMQFIGQ